MKRRTKSVETLVRAWKRSNPGEHPFIRIDLDAIDGTFWAVGCIGDKRDFTVIRSTSNGKTISGAIRNMLRESKP